MKALKLSMLVSILFAWNCSSIAQVIQETGYIYSRVAANISSMPLDSGNHYNEPDVWQLDTWESTLAHLLVGNYSAASDSANEIGYNLINFTDTFSIPFTTYYILENASTNYWGTYVYNPNYCRSLVIQSPHAKRDANTGHQGIHVFRKTQSMFYQVNGTHRCNSSVYSTCTGSTSGCTTNGTSEPYGISDLAHNVQSLFQKTTEVLFNSFNDTYFIQLHGFFRLPTDPYVILSNGTQDTPTVDYLPLFASNLYNTDSVLTFKIAHIDTAWTRLRGFWNTQGRLINEVFDPCEEDAFTTTGRFFHVEQEYNRLRENVGAWNKVYWALSFTFPCVLVSSEEEFSKTELTVYPNPTGQILNVEWTADDMGTNVQVFDLMGKNVTQQVTISKSDIEKATINLNQLPSAGYVIKVGEFSSLIFKE